MKIRRSIPGKYSKPKISQQHIKLNLFFFNESYQFESDMLMAATYCGSPVGGGGCPSKPGCNFC